MTEHSKKGKKILLWEGLTQLAEELIILMIILMKMDFSMLPIVQLNLKVVLTLLHSKAVQSVRKIDLVLLIL